VVAAGLEVACDAGVAGGVAAPTAAALPRLTAVWTFLAALIAPLYRPSALGPPEFDELLGLSAITHSAKKSTVATRSPRSGRETLSMVRGNHRHRRRPDLSDPNARMDV
jgi:hypothetical protein